ncbi:hypothetical protein GCM10007103_13760 [Salinimicrobium marinum]|uniref:CarboxypepD_reg-like domain-containing protein n=1 Tax=Salinimicrobium marinum TaxID=680283 RepID=A0A918SCM9_9FLAO|nr:carboxypeptidase-like regulatory domain-containing protein [Salinimicrobium marinum]GHA33457.1 hypothetical protein GCM10007103_13760 [Salinimicrobium marinum]
METKLNVTGGRALITLLLILMGLGPHSATAFYQETETTGYDTYKGKVVDQNSSRAISSAYLSVDGTNITTVTNSEGDFSLKVPEDIFETTVTVSAMGYAGQKLALSYFKEGNTVIEMQESVEELSEVSIFSATDAKSLVREVLSKRGDNYFTEDTQMKAFYRETIKKGSRNVSLSEAVVEIHKKPYDSWAKDEISLIKSRKSADYERLDTLALKLRGGPFNTLHIDLMKNPQFIFNRDELDNYEFEFDDPARINNKYLYVVDFRELYQGEPWYFGKLFIDAETLTLVKADFNLNVDDRKAAANLFVKKKPGGTKAYPVNVNYEVNYREQNGKWYYGYGRAELEFVINWKRKLFNSRYTVNSEMAVTDWERNPDGKVKRDDSFINERVVMADDASGFNDMAFWGENNIIEPDKSIENAIEKIQQQMRRN